MSVTKKQEPVVIPKPSAEQPKTAARYALIIGCAVLALTALIFIWWRRSDACVDWKYCERKCAGLPPNAMPSHCPEFIGECLCEETQK
ncbi:MAG: hypothetical protein QM765_51355 [Myxococcales bacterium]